MTNRLGPKVLQFKSREGLNTSTDSSPLLTSPHHADVRR